MCREISGVREGETDPEDTESSTQGLSAEGHLDDQLSLKQVPLMASGWRFLSPATSTPLQGHDTVLASSCGLSPSALP